MTNDEIKLAQVLVARLGELGQERDDCLAILAMWYKVAAQGIEFDDVESLGFSPTFMTTEEKLAARRKHPHAVSFNPYNWPIIEKDGRRLLQIKAFNYVLLKNGTRVKLSPMVERAKTSRKEEASCPAPS